MSRKNNRWEEVRMELGNEFRYLQTDFEDMDTAVADYFGLNKTDMRVLDFATRGDKPITAGEGAALSPPAEGGGNARRVHPMNGAEDPPPRKHEDLRPGGRDSNEQAPGEGG